MNLNLANFIGMAIVSVLVIIYIIIKETEIERLRDSVSGYQNGMDYLAKLCRIDNDRAALAEAKCKAYACIFGNDPLRYHAIARRNEAERLGCDKPCVAVDLDGVILQYDEWKGPLHYGEPVPGVTDGLETLRCMGFKIVVYTTRANPLAAGNQGFTAVEQINLVAGYLKAWRIPFDYISLFKPLANYYIDDRAIRFKDWKQAIKDITKLEAANEEKAE